MDTLPKVIILRAVWDQQYERAGSGRLRLKQVADLAPSAQRIHSPHDPDARYSTKTTPEGEPDTEWVGTKCHLSETCDPDSPNLVTDVHTTPATDPGVSATTAIQDRLIARDLVTFRFRVRDCRPCPPRDQCTKAANVNLGRSITIHPEPVHQARVNAHQAQQGNDWGKIYRLRAGVETTITQAVRGPDLRHSRYRGLAKNHLQNVLTAMALNITRLGAPYNTNDDDHDVAAEGKKRPRRPPTRIHQLCRDHGLTDTTTAA
jgi:hypothetical protein